RGALDAHLRGRGARRRDRRPAHRPPRVDGRAVDADVCLAADQICEHLRPSASSAAKQAVCYDFTTRPIEHVERIEMLASHRRFAAALLVAVAPLYDPLATARGTDMGQPASVPRAVASGSSVRFEVNAGQTDREVRFVARSARSALFLTPTG